MGDREETYQTYWDDWSMVEVRNGSDQVLKSRRAGMWGLTYIDELVQIGINVGPTANDYCGHFFWAVGGGRCCVAGIAAVAPVVLRAPSATAAGTSPMAAVPPYPRPETVQRIGAC